MATIDRVGIEQLLENRLAACSAAALTALLNFLSNDHFALDLRTQFNPEDKEVSIIGGGVVDYINHNRSH